MFCFSYIVLRMLCCPYSCIQPRWRPPPWLLFQGLPFSNFHSALLATYQWLPLLQALHLLTLTGHTLTRCRLWKWVRSKGEKRFVPSLSTLTILAPQLTLLQQQQKKTTFELFMLVSFLIFFVTVYHAHLESHWLNFTIVTITLMGFNYLLVL